MIGLGPSLSLGAGRNARIFVLDLTTGSLPSGMTAAGGVNGTRVNASGLIVPASAGRFDYSPTSVGTPLGLLIEQASTNNFFYSEQFDNAYWQKTNATVTADQAVSPTGASTADFLLPNTVSGRHPLFKSAQTTLANGTYSILIYAKPAGYNFLCSTFMYSGSSGGGGRVIDLTNGAITTLGTDSLTCTATAVAAGGGWYRCVLTVTNAATNPVDFTIFGASPSGTPTYDAGYRTASFVGDGTSGIYVFGGQFEAGLGTSYVPTTTASVTRAADAVSFTIPAGVGHLTYTFDDNSTQAVAASPGAYTVPTNLNRARIKSIVGSV